MEPEQEPGQIWAAPQHRSGLTDTVDTRAWILESFQKHDPYTAIPGGECVDVTCLAGYQQHHLRAGQSGKLVCLKYKWWTYFQLLFMHLWWRSPPLPCDFCTVGITQLSYIAPEILWEMSDSNPEPLPRKSGALPMSHHTFTNEPPNLLFSTYGSSQFGLPKHFSFASAVGGCTVQYTVIICYTHAPLYAILLCGLPTVALLYLMRPAMHGTTSTLL